MPSHINSFNKRPQANMRLICFPYAGGTSSVFRPWQVELPDQIELCGIDYPGRVHLKDKAAQSMQEMVEILYPEIVPYFDKPCVFFGHSFGAAVAYALTRRLASDGMLPKHLFVSSRYPPQIGVEKLITCNQSDTDFINALEKKYGQSIPEAILKNKELLAIFLPVLKNDLKINEDYQENIEESIEVPLTLYYGAEDAFDHVASLEKWQETTNHIFRCRVFQGGHFFIDTERESLIKDMLNTVLM